MQQLKKENKFPLLVITTHCKEREYRLLGRERERERERLRSISVNLTRVWVWIVDGTGYKGGEWRVETPTQNGPNPSHWSGVWNC